ncbi:hypothetical protein MHSWG343_10020 [Candidatus Mycoplasma haematohominis]|uniref:Uncharacterized protein n=1 Tax=Candidatus Mycoplasma haematohominis TaxID=1494318 RepID=A0A478FSE4_9MOLU|nr:hypothetical protein MHSWG343_10020 [Candidatus Mycoplasma haemohominis]
MKIFNYLFNKYGIPALFIGSTGIGIKTYLSKNGYSFVSSIANIPSDLINTIFQIDNPEIPREKQTYLDALTSSGYTVVSETTKDEVLQNILIQRLFPSRHSQIQYTKNRLFKGSPEITLTRAEYTNKDNKKADYLQKPAKTETDKLKNACIVALKGEEHKDEFSVRHNGQEQTDAFKELSRLREWCTEPKVKHVLGRHKLTLLSTDQNKDDDKWKEVIAGGWFKQENLGRQTFIKEIDNFLGDKKDTGISTTGEVTNEQIEILKKQCKEVLEKNFERKNFYVTKDFIDGMENNNNKQTTVDEFQEAALFCSEPITAKDYVEKAMQGNVDAKLDEKDKQDYCFVEEKPQPSDYSSIKTNDPMAGKTFWCAVRMVYAPKEKPVNSKS